MSSHMIYGFRLGITIRVILLVLVVFLLTYLVMSTTHYISMGIISMVIVYQIFNLIYFVDSTNRQLQRFLEAINYSDFSQTFSSKSFDGSLASLNTAFNTIIEKFKNERSSSQENYRYLQTVVQHIGIGLFSFDHEGNVELINTAAKRLLDISHLTNIHQLKTINEPIHHGISGLKSGGKTLINCTINNQRMQLAAYATEFRMKQRNYKLISLHNINSELEEKEMEAWQNLTQVLAHEIMNSITPIASLSDTVNSMLSENLASETTNSQLPQDTVSDVKEALETINNRSLGLMRFVNSYRNFTQIPTPNFELVSAGELLSRVSNLMKGEAISASINVTVTVEPESLELTADEQLIEQALINLVKNAFLALKNTKDPQVSLRGKLDKNGRTIIEIEDNGPGIKPSLAEKIFVPFYTTRPSGTQRGSGIGLSLSRQIMRLHGGSLILQSDVGKGTKFSLRF